MLRGYNRQKTGRSARFALEPLEERVELLGGRRGRAVHGRDRPAQRPIPIAGRADRLRTSRAGAPELDVRYEAALDEAAARLADGHAAATRDGLAHATARIDRSYNQLVRNVDHSVNVLTRQVTHRASQLGARYVASEPAIADAAQAAVQQFRNGTATLGASLDSEVLTMRDTARGAIGSAGAVIAQLRVAGASAPAQAQAEDDRLSSAAQSRMALDQNSDNSALSTYDRAFTALQSELGVLPPGPVISPHTVRVVRPHIGAAASAAAGADPAINGLGTGTVTFTGLPGPDATSGTGRNGDGNGVEATAGVGYNPVRAPRPSPAPGPAPPESARP